MLLFFVFEHQFYRLGVQRRACNTKLYSTSKPITPVKRLKMPIHIIPHLSFSRALPNHTWVNAHDKGEHRNTETTQVSGDTEEDEQGNHAQLL